MESIKDKVAIVGVGCTHFGELWDKGPEDMLVEAAYEAYEDSGVDPDDIQAAWVGTTGTGLTGQILAYPLKLNYIPITRVENACATGTDAFRNACHAVAAGRYDVVMVAGIDKFKDTGFGGLPIQKPFFDPSNVQPEVMFPTQFALLATRYFHQYGLSYEEGKKTLARIAVKNHHNGTMSPKAHFRREITMEQAMNAPMISWPLGLF
ncbi:MAG: acetyl-CoA acetyltransferase, partial [Chloroflexota bacterium]|nr:acetyl-CoA acetyltransferase [Chloroflexota bacterium]